MRAAAAAKVLGPAAGYTASTRAGRYGASSSEELKAEVTAMRRRSEFYKPTSLGGNGGECMHALES